MRPIISVRNLSKQYRIGAKQAAYGTLRDSIAGALRNPFLRNGSDSDDNTIWALKDVSFDIMPGEVVGIIGRNGAGKSTLLKILSRITEPTSGEIDIYGRVGSLLEVGTGFHAELTGQENIYLNGAILGMKRREIDRKFDEIVDFAEIRKFIDTPVKHYSSGMFMRLAFAVAAHLEPEILLVDEVLAVGDTNFQKKCLGKMQEVGREGRTILFVSHNMAAIQNLCKRVIVLRGGSVRFDGETYSGIKHYMDYVVASADGNLDLRSHYARRRGCKPLLKRVRLLDDSGVAKASFTSSEAIMIELTFDPVIPITDPQFGIGIDDEIGNRVYTLATYLSDAEIPPLKKECKVVCGLRELSLAPGRYYLSLSAGTSINPLIDALDNAVSFDVEGDDFFGNGRAIPIGLGKALIRSKWETMEI